MATSRIEWTDETWNPVTGCTRVSKGCDLCYAATMTRRLEAMGNDKYSGLINKGKNHFNGVTKIHPDTLDIPVRQKKPTMYFVNSMSDLFHPGVSTDFIVDVFEVMARTPRHVFQVLTKRPDRMQEIMDEVWGRVAQRMENDCVVPLSNVWLGTSVEDDEVMSRIAHLAETMASIRFLSCEPLLGPLTNMNLDHIDWVIVGGESGHGARPFNVRWAEDIISQCKASGVSCFVKQLGAQPYTTMEHMGGTTRFLRLQSKKGGDPLEWPAALRVRDYPRQQMAI